MSTDPINQIGETISQADQRYALTDAMSAAYREEFDRWKTRLRSGVGYDMLRRNDAGALEIKDGVPDTDDEFLFRLYRERAAMGASLLIAEKGLK